MRVVKEERIGKSLTRESQDEEETNLRVQKGKKQGLNGGKVLRSESVVKVFLSFTFFLLLLYVLSRYGFGKVTSILFS